LTSPSTTTPAPRISTDSNRVAASPGGISLKTNDLNRKVESPARKSNDLGASPTESKKRRSSSTAKAKEIFTQAKNSLIHGDKDGPQTPMQKLSKTDAALSVPQGSNNNSAGESQPTLNSSFLVGVTEDKNRKCRRTMEDTHSYLYNFLGTPAPVLPSDASLKSKRSLDDKSSLTTVPSEPLHHVVETDNGYFAIFDGHAGTFAAEWCGKKVHVILEDLMRKNPNTPVPELLDQTYTAADNQLEKLPLKNSGCTAITAVLRWEDRVPTNHSATGSQAIASLAAAAAREAESQESKDAHDSTPRSNSTAEAAAQVIQEARQKATRQRVLYTANVGDARIVLCRNGKALRLSYDHKGMDENEGRRISKAGGLILNNRVNGVLAVTRALGDSYLKDLVTGHPYTTETVIQPDQDEFLILACDGVSFRFRPACSRRLTRISSGTCAPIKRPSIWSDTSRIHKKPPRCWSITLSLVSLQTISPLWWCDLTGRNYRRTPRSTLAWKASWPRKREPSVRWRCSSAKPVDIPA